MNTDEVRKWVREYVTGCEHPDFRAYAGDLANSSMPRFLWFMEYLVRRGKMRHGRILDIGCGFGWQAVAISMLASGTVVANDIRPLMTAIVSERVGAIRRKGAPVSVDVLTGDICTEKLPEASFDAIVCNQTIEHVHDLAMMLRACFQTLRPGGSIVITNDNNALNRRHFTKIQHMWKRRDSDWDFIKELKEKRSEENREIQPYAVMREQIVRRMNPGLSDHEVQAIVEATAGLVKPDIESVARNYNPIKSLPTPPKLSWCRNPLTGEYCERQFDPFAVADMMRSLGLLAHVRHGFRKWPLSWFDGITIRPINRWLFERRRLFIIVGLKPR